MNVQHDDRPKRLYGEKECWMKKKEGKRRRRRRKEGRKRVEVE
jgi:hypothetical protein